MDHSLNQIAHQILNGVYAGLKGPNNFSMSIRQIKDEFAQARNRHIYELVNVGQFDPEPFRQTIRKLPISKKDFTGMGSVASGIRKEFHAEIPEVMHIQGVNPVGYVSVMDKTFPFKVIYGADIFHISRDRYSAKAPTIWIEDKNLWLLNPPISNIQHIKVRPLLENPRALNGVAGETFMDDDPYPAPGFVIDAIRNKMVNDYIRQYRLGNPQPTLMAGDLNLNTPNTK